MTFLVLLNPRAAHGKAGRMAASIVEAFEASGAEAEIVETSEPGHATEIVRDADLSSYTGVVASGGDGSLFEVVNGVMQRAESDRPPIGLLPLGTGNAFCRDIGLEPGNWRSAVEFIAKGSTCKVDVAKLDAAGDSFFYVNIAGIGFVRDAGKTAATLKFTGRMAYTLGTLWRCLAMRSHALELLVDGRPLSQDCLFMEASNSRYTGSSFLIAPAARIDDGELDLVIVRRLPRFRLLRLFPTIYSGKHVEHDEVTVLKGREIEIRGPAGLEFMVDGEFRGVTPARISCQRHAIQMFCAR